MIKRIFNIISVLLFLQVVQAQIFIPFGFWAGRPGAVNTAPVISTIFNRSIYEGNNPYIPFTISDAEDILTCSLLNLDRSSTNTTLVPLANITFTGAFPFCYVNIVPAAGLTGTSDITITLNDNGAPNLQDSTTFTVTVYAVQSVAIVPVYAVIPKNTTFKYRAVASYSDATSQDISTAASWTENSTYTTIDSTGLLTVNNSVTGYPSLNITATYASFTGGASATLNSSTVTGFFVTPSAASINAGSVLNLQSFVTTSDGGTIEVTGSSTWATASATVANVNNYSPKGEVTAYSNGGPIEIGAGYSGFSANADITVAAGAESQTEVGSGLVARYFTGMGFNNFFRIRLDSTVDFDWDTGSNPAGDADAFSVRWTGQILAPETGTYRFYSYSDDGFRLWVNGTLLDDFWTDHGPTASTSNNIVLNANTKYDIMVEFYENGGNAWARLAWKLPSSSCNSFASCTIVPRSNLFPDSGYGVPLDLDGTSDANPGDRDFTNDNLVRYYSADGAGAIDDNDTVSPQVGSGNLTADNNNSSGLSYVAGLIGQAFSFDGNDDSFSAPNTSLPTGTNARGVSLWINPNNTGSDMGVLFYGANTNNNGFGVIVLSGGNVRVNGGGTQNCSSSNTVNWNEWNHIAVRRVSGNANVSVYVNGVATSCGNRNWSTSAGNLLLGRHPGVTNYFSGLIDEVGIWNADIAANSNNFLPTLIYQRQKPQPDYSN